MAEYEKKFTLNVPSSTENLALIRDFVSNICSRAGFDEKETAQLALAVDEACANVIEHAYGLEAAHEVTVRIFVEDDEIDFVVIDNGKGFNPGNVRQDEIEELIEQRKSGGLGLRLIRTIMDDVRYQIIAGEKNELRMVKKRKK